ncbi:ATP-grasp domain-containing protein [Flavobacterium sp.]|uniref:ATP-grasp domain-containing protein n=1 Tax=Flavobacterium sp. TaxID=239 RepID=UPI003C32A865
METAKTFVCISNYFKGTDFLIQLKELGNTVYLVTSEKMRDKNWPSEAINEVFYMPGQDVDWNLEHLVIGIANLMKSQKVDAIVALDDFDVEKATYLRENLRIKGMGQSTGRYFRDKLAMRMLAKSVGILVPVFSSLFNDEAINSFMETIPAPWILKPRSEASSIGISKILDKEMAWRHINELGANRFKYLLEQFIPGNVYHCDSLVYNETVLFSLTSKYITTPLEISQSGGVFRSVTMVRNSDDDQKIKEINKQILESFGLKNGAAHTEFIKCEATGQIYFLETSSRVGGAHLAEMVEAASGINLWKEWASIEDALVKNKKYNLPSVKENYAGIVLTLSHLAYPDLSSFSDPEVCFRVPLEYHAGLIVKSKNYDKILALIDDYTCRLTNGIAAVGEQKRVTKLH